MTRQVKYGYRQFNISSFICWLSPILYRINCKEHGRGWRESHNDWFAWFWTILFIQHNIMGSNLSQISQRKISKCFLMLMFWPLWSFSSVPRRTCSDIIEISDCQFIFCPSIVSWGEEYQMLFRSPFVSCSCSKGMVCMVQCSVSLVDTLCHLFSLFPRESESSKTEVFQWLSQMAAVFCQLALCSRFY